MEKERAKIRAYLGNRLYARVGLELEKALSSSCIHEYCCLDSLAFAVKDTFIEVVLKLSLVSDNCCFRPFSHFTNVHRSHQLSWRLLWVCMVMSSVVVACGFVYMQTSEFTKATVVTTVDTTTAPLSDVYFPSVTICNINQVCSERMQRNKTT